MVAEFIIQNSWVLYLYVGLFSLCVGSLLNVVIYRLPIMIHAEWKSQCYECFDVKEGEQENKINLFLPRSFCPQCKIQIKFWQNIPVISYLFLKGKCHGCRAPISMRYPLIEFFTLITSLYACWHFGFTAQLIFALLAIWLLIPLFFIDLDHQLLPDSLTLSLLWLGLIANTQGLFAQLPNAVLSAAAGYLVLWLFIQIFYLITGKIGMGNGDFKLLAAFGAWFGWKMLPLILLLSSISGALIGLIYLKMSHKNKDTTIPFGPFLCIAGLISLFWGDKLISSYIAYCG
jgi:leader peptidase (prepilin peptidase)/N-methyltransferase